MQKLQTKKKRVLYSDESMGKPLVAKGVFLLNTIKGKPSKISKKWMEEASAILYKGSPIAAYYFSSSGGETASAVDVWGTVVPYALSVPDPWSLNSRINSKYAHWQRSIGQTPIARAFGLPDILTLQILNRSASGTVRNILGTSSTGKIVRLSGEIFRSRANLPSAWFDLLGPQFSDANPSPTPSPTVSFAPTPIPTRSLRKWY